ncbi:DeoR family transcriptional regulator [Lentzea sp. NPDC102401]|uniref:DeoR family transcriptional regulator n=1 Tax=Lentzea sp. NPDC102401 TaxID=3364128 RepID=UPI0038016021
MLDLASASPPLGRARSTNNPRRERQGTLSFGTFLRSRKSAPGQACHFEAQALRGGDAVDAGQQATDLSIAGRRRHIVALIGVEGFVQVRSLAQRLGVSEVTIRQDLRCLDELGALQRVRGGATATALPSARPVGLEDWSDSAVSAMASAFVRSGDTIVLDNGPGVRSVAEALVSRRDLSGVVVHTESLTVLAPFADHLDRFTVVVPAGTLNVSHRVVPDEDTDVLADLAILSCAGISVDGLLAHTESEAFARRRTAFAARRGVVVIPPGTVDAPGTHLACSLEHVDACITSRRLPDPVADSLRAAGLRTFVTG